MFYISHRDQCSTIWMMSYGTANVSRKDSTEYNSWEALVQYYSWWKKFVTFAKIRPRPRHRNPSVTILLLLAWSGSQRRTNAELKLNTPDCAWTILQCTVSQCFTVVPDKNRPSMFRNTWHVFQNTKPAIHIHKMEPPCLEVSCCHITPEMSIFIIHIFS